MSNESIKANYSDEIMYEMIIQMKDAFKVLIWFLVPLTSVILIINIWKVYEWIYQRKQNKKNKHKNKKLRR